MADSAATHEPARGPSLSARLGVLLALAGVAAALTLVFLSMRSVMEIGGACASGGPFVPIRPCPRGVPGLLIGGIWGGMILAFVYIGLSIHHRVPSFAGLIWPALFISLGWNFLEYGISPPFGEGLAWGWLVCGVLFMLMGGIPLWIWVGVLRRQGMTRAASRIPLSLRPVAGIPQRVSWTPAGSDGAEDLASVLERLDALHRSGALDDSEYKAAKRRAIAGGS
ncbi:MAG: hypothetical protein WD652_05940 [Acidimicrobiia bacterium]